MRYSGGDIIKIRTRTGLLMYSDDNHEEETRKNCKGNQERADTECQIFWKIIMV